MIASWSIGFSAELTSRFGGDAKKATRFARSVAHFVSKG